MFTKDKFSVGQKIPQKYKNRNKICTLYTPSKLVIYTFTFRYSLARRAFLKPKYYVVCTEFPSFH